MNAVPEQVSTGYRVADATDDGAAYAVAQSVRSDVSALNAADQQLGSPGPAVHDDIKPERRLNLMGSMRDVLVALANGNTTGNERTRSAQQYNSLLSNLKSNLEDANYRQIADRRHRRQHHLLGGGGSQRGRGTYGISTFSGSALYSSLAFTTTQLAGAASWRR